MEILLAGTGRGPRTPRLGALRPPAPLHSVCCVDHWSTPMLLGLAVTARMRWQSTADVVQERSIARAVISYGHSGHSVMFHRNVHTVVLPRDLTTRGNSDRMAIASEHLFCSHLGGNTMSAERMSGTAKRTNEPRPAPTV